MWANAIKNRFWLITSLETLILGLSFISVNDLIEDIPAFQNWLGIADDPRVGAFLVAAGTFGLVVSLWDIHRFWSRRVMTGLFGGIWLAYTVTFAIHDIFGPATFPNWTTILAGAVFIRILAEAGWGDRD